MDTPVYFSCGDHEMRYLQARDPALGRVIELLGPVRREVIPDLFSALVNAILGQQISSKAQRTVWERFCAHFSPLMPEHLAAFPPEALCACGISGRKAGYIHKIALAACTGALDLAVLPTLPDAEVCRRLCHLDGVGPWTAEMLLIFSLQRPNVLSEGDFGIVRGLRMLSGENPLTKDTFERYRQLYSPYATLASLYLWEISAGRCPHLHDPASPPSRKNTPCPVQGDGKSTK